MSLLLNQQAPADLGDRLRDACYVTAEFLSDIINADLPALSIAGSERQRLPASSG